MARYSSPALGRFLSPDPIGYGDGLNLYAYVGNDPVNLVDPSGEFLQAAIGAVSSVILGGFIRVATGGDFLDTEAIATDDRRGVQSRGKRRQRLDNINEEIALSKPKQKYVHRVSGLGKPYSKSSNVEYWYTELAEFIAEIVKEFSRRNYVRIAIPFYYVITLYRTDAIDEIPLRQRQKVRVLRIIRGFEDAGSVDLRDLKDFHNLRELYIETFIKVKRISFLGHFSKLARFVSDDILDEPIPFEKLRNLQELCVPGKNLANLSNAASLRYIRMQGTGPTIPNLDNISNLTRIDLMICRKITDLSLIRKNKSISVIHLFRCPRLATLNADDNGFPELIDLTIEECNQLKDLSNLRNCKKLKRLEVRNCKALSDLHVLDNLPGPIDLIAVNCRGIDKNERERLANSPNIRHYYFV